jgi:LacI family transcriptional regulator
MLGRLMVMMPPTKTTLNDIAQRTGLSVATVSRALHRADSPNVSLRTRDRVLNIARELGYRPNLLSRSLATGRTNTVAYWTYDAFSPYYSSVARHICAQAAQRGYFVHVHNTFNPVEGPGSSRENEGTELALSFDGIIACDVAYAGNDYAAWLHRPGVPIVGIGINYPFHCDTVAIDLRHGATLAMTHLLAQGRRRIAHMAHDQPVQRGDARAQVYQSMLHEAGLQTEWITVRDHRRDFARTAIQEYVRDHGCPEAIFCVNDDVAIGCYRGLADLGIEAPDDVLLMGYDGLIEMEYHRCPITTVAPPVERICALAWDFLEARLQEPDRPLQQVSLKPELIIRESTIGRRPLSADKEPALLSSL